MLCKSCGAQIADNSVFCTNCGVRVQPVGEAAQENAVVQTEAVQAETVQAEEAAQVETVQTETAQAEETVQVVTVQTETAQAEEAAQVETVQTETAQAEETAQVETVQTENVQENTAVDGQASFGQPQMNGMPDGQASSGQPQLSGMPDGQASFGQPQMNGMPDGQASFGQPQMNGMPDGQAPFGQPQMGGMPDGQAPFGQPQMNGMPYGQAPFGQPQMGGMPNGQASFGQPQMNGMPNGQAVQQPKKPFVMPAGIVVAGGILAVAAAAIFVCVLLLGKPEEKKSDLAVNTLAVPAQQQADIGEEELNVDLSGVTYQLEIPETDGYRAAQELAAGYLFEDSDTRYLEESDLYAYTDSELWHAYYEILAREGVDLSEIDDEEHEYFQRKSWYEPSISLIDVLEGIDEEQQERYAEMLENGEDPSYEILLEAEILNETEVYNMKLIEEYVTYGTTSAESPEDALEDMLEE